jgi:predicted AAA+ superfamily ATPase
MIIIHGMNEYPRHALRALNDRLRVMPAVVVSGARQTGKSTLVERLTGGQRAYRTLDDWDVLTAARTDPAALLDLPGPLTLDEVQREPNLLLAVKRAIDRRREAGRFLLTGSANLALMHGVSESLAGRASYLTLWPMTRGERLGAGRVGHWDLFFQQPVEQWLSSLQSMPAVRGDWREQVCLGGFPTPALTLPMPEDRAVWFDGYVRTYLERDLQALSSVSDLPDFRRLMRAVCLRIGQLTNQTELGRDVALAQPTVHRWLNLLEASYLLVRLPAYAVNRTKRLIKTPKVYWADTGLAMHVAGLTQPTGALFENTVLLDLLAWRDSRIGTTDLMYWRTVTGVEVDFVVESQGRLLPIEVKTTARPTVADTAGLRTFLADYGAAAPAGLLLHTGDNLEWIAPGVLAVPWWRML